MRSLVAGVILALAASLVTTPAAAGVEAPSPACRDVHVPVTLHGALSQRMYGRYCTPPGGDPSVVQVLLPGATYAHQYWDYQAGGRRNSYVAHAARAGWSTLAVDRLGSGRSTRPPSAAVTTTSSVEVLGQVIRQLRSGRVTGAAQRRVVTVGHSLGAGIAQQHAATVADPAGRTDGLVLTGVTHHFDHGMVAEAFTRHLRPALEERNQLGVPDPGYVTTIPGHREPLFHAGRSRGELAAEDEATKTVVAAPELTETLLPGFTAPLSTALTRRITVPTLMAVGERDRLFCHTPTGGACSSGTALYREEAPHYAPAARLETVVLPDAGHSLHVADNAADYFAAVHGFLDRHVR